MTTGEISSGEFTKKGEYARKESSFRNFITADGSSGFKAERDRYHLYVSLACPWAHRTLIVRKLKGLEDVITITVADWMTSDKGWTFTDKKPGCIPDTVNNCQYVRDVYHIADPAYDSKYTVPMVWDKKKQTVVNNESSEILRMFNSEFNDLCVTEDQRSIDLYPEHLRAQIDEINTWIYSDINNGVYKCGMALSQEAYEDAVATLFSALDKVESILSSKRYLTGSQLTEADVRLFTTLVRFDWVYHGHFKCNKRRIIDYPNIWGFTRDIYQTGGIGDTVNKSHIRQHYYKSHKGLNPRQIVAVGPDLDFTSPHGRGEMFS